MLVRGEITWGELRQAQRKNRLHSDTLAADVALARNLWVAIAATLKRMGKTESSRTRYELAFDSSSGWRWTSCPAMRW
jgi:hypothetical protein